MQAGAEVQGEKHQGREHKTKKQETRNTIETRCAQRSANLPCATKIGSFGVPYVLAAVNAKLTNALVELASNAGPAPWLKSLVPRLISIMSGTHCEKSQSDFFGQK